MEEFPENSSECRRRSLTLMAQNESWRSLISELTNQRRAGTVVDALSTPSGDGRGVLWWAAFHGSVEGMIKNFIKHHKTMRTLRPKIEISPISSDLDETINLTISINLKLVLVLP